jgi:hypothetical protein
MKNISLNRRDLNATAQAKTKIKKLSVGIISSISKVQI